MARDGIGKALARRAITKLEEATGQELVVAGHRVMPEGQADLLEAAFEDYRVLQRELELIGYGLFDYANRQPQEISAMSRRKIVQRARMVWANDPQAGASVELMNDFCFGRGVPRPRCKDPKVQEVVDDAWDDPDNQEVLTTLEAQLALGVDLALQSNVFMLMFDDGEDGKVKLSILRHDDVQAAVPDPEVRHRVLYFAARHVRVDWDYANDQPAQPDLTGNEKLWYYEHWRNVELAAEDQGRDEPLEKAPADRTKPGKVYHLRINRGTEQIFGVPRFQRTLRWYSAYNDYVKDRLDIVKAAAQIIVKNKIKGSPNQVAQQATKIISRASMLTAQVPPDGMTAGTRGAAGMWHENESAQLEPFNMNTQAGNAQQDAQIIRAPIAAAERWTQAYFGDSSNSNLATATSLELPILKMVESRQEVYEQLFRWFIDRVIEKAVESNLIPEELDPSEQEPKREPLTDQEIQASLVEACQDEVDAGRELVEVARVAGFGESCWLVVARDGEEKLHYTLVEGYEDQIADEESTKRDLSYEFKMPSPLRRMMSDLITAIQALATTFDPNNTNVNLSRALLTIALGEGLEVQDAPGMVDDILPEGWKDPAVQAQFAAQGLGPDGKPLPQANAGFGPESAGAPFPARPGGLGAAVGVGGGDGYTRAPAQSRTPEQLRSGPYQSQQALIEAWGEDVDIGVTKARDGSDLYWPHPRRRLELVTAERAALDEAGIVEMEEPARARLNGRQRELEDTYRGEVIGPALDALARAEADLAAN